MWSIETISTNVISSAYVHEHKALQVFNVYTKYAHT